MDNKDSTECIENENKSKRADEISSSFQEKSNSSKISADVVNNCETVTDTNDKNKDYETVLNDESDDDVYEDVIDADEEYLCEKMKNMSDTEKLEAKEEALDLKKSGNTYFKDEKYTEAVKEYTKALNICPLSFSNERSILYANRAACRARLNEKEEAILDCNKALELNPNYMKALLRRAQLYRNTEKLDEALNDYQRVLQLDPNVLEARQACMDLPEEIKERNEKLKTEMLGLYSFNI
ncbi:tetratricopeptide repeat protein 1-like [Centruroides sculpturatus]|uniref:tetratricopeptide repeat protein 1-like n=1 Tax=Centruroides sculpturatus TaxID=218467 RepID=UPI000C6EABBD|nr:tetratricopeptide repeat protein 1-like [Centruroides sculpturatus]